MVKKKMFYFVTSVFFFKHTVQKKARKSGQLEQNRSSAIGGDFSCLWSLLFLFLLICFVAVQLDFCFVLSCWLFFSPFFMKTFDGYDFRSDSKGWYEMAEETKGLQAFGINSIHL